MSTKFRNKSFYTYFQKRQILGCTMLNKMKLMLCALFNYNMGDKIRRLSMNVALNTFGKKY